MCDGSLSQQQTTSLLLMLVPVRVFKQSLLLCLCYAQSIDRVKAFTTIPLRQRFPKSIPRTTCGPLISINIRFCASRST